MNLYWDYENQKLMDGLNSGQQIQRITMVLRDQVDITLYVTKYNTLADANELVDCPVGKTPLLGLKGTTQAKLAGGYLASQAIWTKTATGTYAATINLATTQMVTELGTGTSAALKAEFCMRDVDEKDHFSSQLDVTVNYDVNGGGEAAAVSVYLSTSAIVREELVGGVKYLVFYNSDGIEYMRVGPPGA